MSKGGDRYKIRTEEQWKRQDLIFKSCLSRENRKDGKQMKDGFQRQAFLAYVRSQYAGTENFFTRELLKNLIDYGCQYQVHSKDQLADFLSDILPDVEFGEVAAFMDDDWLTAYGQEQKREAVKEYGIRVKETKSSLSLFVKGNLVFHATVLQAL